MLTKFYIPDQFHTSYRAGRITETLVQVKPISVEAKDVLYVLPHEPPQSGEEKPTFQIVGTTKQVYMATTELKLNDAASLPSIVDRLKAAGARLVECTFRSEVGSTRGIKKGLGHLNLDQVTGSHSYLYLPFLQRTTALLSNGNQVIVAMPNDKFRELWKPKTAPAQSAEAV